MKFIFNWALKPKTTCTGCNDREPINVVNIYGGLVSCRKSEPSLEDICVNKLYSHRTIKTNTTYEERIWLVAWIGRGSKWRSVHKLQVSYPSQDLYKYFLCRSQFPMSGCFGKQHVTVNPPNHYPKQKNNKIG